MENMKFDYNYNNMKENTRETVEEVQVREFKKSSKLNNVLYDVRGPVVERRNSGFETEYRKSGTIWIQNTGRSDL